MRSTRGVVTDGKRARLRRVGTVLAPVLLVVLTLVLAAGLYRPAAQLFRAWATPATTPSAAGTTLSLASVQPATPAPAPGEPDAARQARPDARPPATPTPARAAAASEPEASGQAEAQDGPAVTRAAEAGLTRLRVQFAQTMLPALEPGDGPADAQDGASAADLTRDARIAGAAAGAAASATPAPAPLAPSRVLSLPPRAGDPFALPGAGSVTTIGHATLLIRAGGFTILTDPDFLRRGEPAHLPYRQVAMRQADPAIELDALPRVDLVVLSRLAEDRFDRVVRRHLPRDVPIVAPPEARATLVAMGFSSVHALPAWGRLKVDRDGGWLQVTSTPTRPGPALLSALAPQSMGSLLEFGRDAGAPAYRIWITGDTRVDDPLLAEWRNRLPEIDLAVLHLGGPGVAGIGSGSMDAAGGLRLLRQLAPRSALPLALDDFGGTPAKALDAAPTTVAMLRDAPQTHVRRLERGDTHRFAPAPRWASARDEAIGP
jgi:L-ascorbate metabolism protein UlaG (beta-lactamase superfamily)